MTTMTYGIGEVAKILNVTTHTIRHWEKTGIIPPARRQQGYHLTDWREYSEQDIKNIKQSLIKRREAKKLAPFILEDAGK